MNDLDRLHVMLTGKMYISMAIFGATQERGAMTAYHQVLMDMGEPMMDLAQDGLTQDAFDKLAARVGALKTILDHNKSNEPKDVSDVIHNIEPILSPVLTGEMGLGISDDDDEDYQNGIDAEEPFEGFHDAPTPFNRERFDDYGAPKDVQGPTIDGSWRSGAELFIEALDLAGGDESKIEGMEWPSHWNQFNIREYVNYSRLRWQKKKAEKAANEAAQKAWAEKLEAKLHAEEFAAAVDEAKRKEAAEQERTPMYQNIPPWKTDSLSNQK